MTFERGAAACFKLHGACAYEKTEPGIETCRRCGTTRFVAYTEAEVDAFDARDAFYDYCRAEYEAADGMGEAEWDARRGSEL